MLYNILRIIIEFLIIFNCANSENIFKQNDKLPPGGLQMCIESFEVHKDKIIRTQDSLALGAKYIMEAEIDDRQNCLRLCCQTNECDVFIYEEKKRGSCYLFHCGPPHDFKCKFTGHLNYTSAVLTNLSYRNSPYIEQAGRSQQEHELKSLRKMTPPQVPADYIYTDAPLKIMTELPKAIVATTSSSPIKTACSRNQYECRTSGDCIAIYNVCDGIPQCADASDEAAELACPTEKSPQNTPPPLIPPPPESPPKYPEIFNHRNNMRTFYETSEPAKSWPLPILHQSSSKQTIIPYPPQAPPQGPPLISYGGPGYIGGWEYRQIYQQTKDSGYPDGSIHVKGDISQYDGQQPHIFNHKRPGMLPENVDGTGYVEPERPFASYYSSQNHPGWQQVPPQMVSMESKMPMFPTVSPLIEKQVLQPETQVLGQPQAGEKLDSPRKFNPSIKKELETQRIIDPPLMTKGDNKGGVEKQEAIKNKKESLVKEDRVVLSKHEEEHQMEEQRVHHFVAEHLKGSNHGDSEQVLRPKGAVISLALGLTVTAIMAALIGCRLRLVRKRGRRGPFAHDADYLVNGMYL